MSTPSLTPDQLQALLSFAARRLGTTPEALARTVRTGGTNALLSDLPPEKAKAANMLLGDRKKLDSLLSSPEMQKLMASLAPDEND